jgi:5-methylcytosine-specific restriction endonuclease McrBC regulatory subunit McrC
MKCTRNIKHLAEVDTKGIPVSVAKFENCEFYVDELVEKKYQEFWKDIVENEDGTLNEEQVKKELCDFSMVMDNCTKAYCEMTIGEISKPNTNFSEVLNKFQEKFYYASNIKDDVRDMLEGCGNLEELKEELKEYFELE